MSSDGDSKLTSGTWAGLQAGTQSHRRPPTCLVVLHRRHEEGVKAAAWERAESEHGQAQESTRRRGNDQVVCKSASAGCRW